MTSDVMRGGSDGLYKSADFFKNKIAKFEMNVVKLGLVGKG